MVNGLEVFKKHFSLFENEYVLIGGVACAILSPTDRQDLPEVIQNDLRIFLSALREIDQDVFKKIGLKNMSTEKLVNQLNDLYSMN